MWKGASQGADKGETRGKRVRGKSYHDITPLLCRYISEWCRSSLTSKAAGASSGGGGSWGIRVPEVLEYLPGDSPMVHKRGGVDEYVVHIADSLIAVNEGAEDVVHHGLEGGG